MSKQENSTKYKIKLYSLAKLNRLLGVTIRAYTALFFTGILIGAAVLVVQKLISPAPLYLMQDLDYLLPHLLGAAISLAAVFFLLGIIGYYCVSASIFFAKETLKTYPELNFHKKDGELKAIPKVMWSSILIIVVLPIALYSAFLYFLYTQNNWSIISAFIFAFLLFLLQFFILRNLLIVGIKGKIFYKRIWHYINVIVSINFSLMLILVAMAVLLCGLILQINSLNFYAPLFPVLWASGIAFSLMCIILWFSAFFLARKFENRLILISIVFTFLYIWAFAPTGIISKLLYKFEYKIGILKSNVYTVDYIKQPSQLKNSFQFIKMLDNVRVKNALPGYSLAIADPHGTFSYAAGYIDLKRKYEMNTLTSFPIGNFASIFILPAAYSFWNSNLRLKQKYINAANKKYNLDFSERNWIFKILQSRKLNLKQKQQIITTILEKLTGLEQEDLNKTNLSLVGYLITQYFNNISMVKKLYSLKSGGQQRIIYVSKKTMSYLKLNENKYKCIKFPPLYGDSDERFYEKLFQTKLFLVSSDTKIPSLNVKFSDLNKIYTDPIRLSPVSMIKYVNVALNKIKRINKQFSLKDEDVFGLKRKYLFAYQQTAYYNENYIAGDTVFFVHLLPANIFIVIATNRDTDAFSLKRGPVAEIINHLFTKQKVRLY